MNSALRHIFCKKNAKDVTKCYATVYGVKAWPVLELVAQEENTGLGLPLLPICFARGAQR